MKEIASFYVGHYCSASLNESIMVSSQSISKKRMNVLPTKSCFQGIWNFDLHSDQQVISLSVLNELFNITCSNSCFLFVVVCSTASTQYWIYNVGAVPKPDRFWKPWTFNDQKAGFFTEFDLGVTNSSFTFVTVHGAGHEVPAYRPAEAFAMFESFFSGIWQLK